MESSSQAGRLPPVPSSKPPSSSRRSARSADDAVDRWCERGILGLILAILVWGPLAFGAVDPAPQVVIQGLTLAVLVLWVGRLWASRSYRFLWPPVSWAVMAVMGYAIVRYRMGLAEGGIEYVARQELILVLIYGALFLAIVNNLSRQESSQIISVTLFGLATLIALYALYQFLTKSGRVLWTLQYEGYFGRGSGTYVCPNHLAGLLEMLLPVALAYTLVGRFKPTAKVFLGYASVAMFVGIAVSVSRGAWVSVALALLILFAFLMRQHGRRLAAVLFLILLIGGGVFFIKNLAVLQRRMAVAKETQFNDMRFELWRPAYQMWKDHPWWGVGLAHFDDRFRAYRPDDIQMRPNYAHNDYLNTLADWGLVGTALIAVAFALLVWTAVQARKFLNRSGDLGAKQSNRSALVLGGMVGLLAILFHSAVDFNMHIPANAIVAVTLMALVSGQIRYATERYWFRGHWVTRLGFTFLCLAAIGYLGTQGWKHARELAFLDRAGRATTVTGKLEALQAAYAVEPMNTSTCYQVAPSTAYQIGELLRRASWEGLENYRDLATQAISWFDRGAQINRFDPYNYLGKGMCLDWLGRPEEGQPFFLKAIELDPRNYYVQGLVGWHYFQVNDLPKAKEWFEKAVFQAHWSPYYKTKKYDTGVYYLGLIDQKLKNPAPAFH